MNCDPEPSRPTLDDVKAPIDQLDRRDCEIASRRALSLFISSISRPIMIQNCAVCDSMIGRCVEGMRTALAEMKAIQNITPRSATHLAHVRFLAYPGTTGSHPAILPVRS